MSYLREKLVEEIIFSAYEFDPFREKREMLRALLNLLYKHYIKVNVSDSNNFIIPNLLLYNELPDEIGFLKNCVALTDKSEGAIFEVGNSDLMTSTALRHEMKRRDDYRNYFLIDVFSEPFQTYHDLKTSKYGKRSNLSKNRNRMLLNQNCFTEGLIANFDFKRICTTWHLEDFDPAYCSENISFCLFKVDLYRTVSTGLNKFAGLMTPGSLILVDTYSDERGQSIKAYQEFTFNKKLPEYYWLDRFGVINF